MEAPKAHRLNQVAKAPYKLIHRMTVGHVDERYGGESLCLRFDPEDKYLAGGFSDHSIKVFNALTGKAAFSLHFTGISDHEKMPITCIRWGDLITRWRPQSSGLKTQNILVATCANATIQHWHVTSGKCLHVIKVDPENHLYCLDYHPGGVQFAVSGKERRVQVYDETTKSLLTTMERGSHGNPGHSNRVYCVKYDPQNPNIILSGGWDQTLQIWDTRTGIKIMRLGFAVGSIFGPYICGDAIDIDDNGMILTGSYRPHECLQLWDLGTRKLIEHLDYEVSKTSLDSGFIYGAEFSKPFRNLIVAGGGGRNEVKVFDRKSDNKMIGSVVDMPKPAMGVNTKNKSNGFAIAGGDGQLRIINIDENH